MNKAARKAVNLSVLQRHDPNISDILDSSSYVVVYKLDEDNLAWTKKGVEGTMFVFKRSSPPTYGFFIMNRLSLQNQMADLTGDMALELTKDYIIYRDDKDIHGIWVYEPSDRERIGEKLMECCKKAKQEELQSIANQPVDLSSAVSTKVQSSVSHSAHPLPSNNARTNTVSEDPLTRMFNDAMSKARVSETSGAPVTSEEYAETTKAVEQSMPDSPAKTNAGETPKTEIPSFLLAILSKDQDKPTPKVSAEELSLSHQQGSKDKELAQSMLLNSLTGSGKQSPTLERGNTLQNGPPLSAELLPASVLPSGLYSNTLRLNGAPGPNAHPSPSSAVAAASLLNRPNGIPSHASPLQAPAFAYSPGMVPSPLAMAPMQGGHMMHPPPPPLHPFHPLGPSMGIPPPPPGQGGPGFPADAMHAAMGAVGFMQQQQRGFIGQGSDVLSKAEFTQQFMGLIQNDPQFMDVLYSNYTAVLARRG